MVIATSAGLTLPAELPVRAWLDPVVERIGFGPASEYVEFCWLPILGPTATWAYRRLGLLILTEPTARLDLADFASSLGLGSGLGRRSKLAGALVRLVHFGVCDWTDQSLAVRRALAPLTLAQANRLTASARAVHDSVVGRPAAG